VFVFILFNANTVVKSTSYLAQQIFGQHLGDIILNSTAYKKDNMKYHTVRKDEEGDGKRDNLYFVATKLTKNNILIAKFANVDRNDILVNTQIKQSSTSIHGTVESL
jgi:hypothetical protein